MLTSIALGLVACLAIIAPYFAYHRFLRGNPSPFRNPSVRSGTVYRELEAVIASRPPEIAALHHRLVYSRELLTLSALAGICVSIVAGAREDIAGALVGWTIAGLSGSLHFALRAYDAMMTEVTYASRWLISPFQYLAEGSAARRCGKWLVAGSIATLIVTLSAAIVVILLVT